MRMCVPSTCFCNALGNESTIVKTLAEFARATFWGRALKVTVLTFSQSLLFIVLLRMFETSVGLVN